MNIHSTLVVTTTLFFGSLAIALPPANDLLAGPAIDREEVTDSDLLSRRLDETGKKQKMNDRVQMRIWMSSLHSVELSSAQQEEVDLLMKELKSKQKDFHKTNGKELASIRKNHNAVKKSDEVPSEDSRARMFELMELAPDITTYQERAWELLTLEQQKSFQLKFQELLEKFEERKSKDRPTADKLQGREVDSRHTDKDSTKVRDGIDSQRESVDDSSFRRIKFLKRLQQLKNDN